MLLNMVFGHCRSQLSCKVAWSCATIITFMGALHPDGPASSLLHDLNPGGFMVINILF